MSDLELYKGASPRFADGMVPSVNDSPELTRPPFARIQVVVGSYLILAGARIVEKGEGECL